MELSPLPKQRRTGPGPRSWAGFTLTELMIVLVIVAVILTIAFPAFTTVTLRSKLKSYANEIVGTVYFARGEAIKRNTPIRMCVVNADEDDCKGSGSWEEGWIVIDPNDVILRRYKADALAAGFKITESSSFHTLTFSPYGLVTPAAVMSVCQNSPEQGIEERKLTIFTSGRPQVETTTVGCP